MRRPERESRERASSGRDAPLETNLLTKRRRRHRRAPATPSPRRASSTSAHRLDAAP